MFIANINNSTITTGTLLITATGMADKTRTYTKILSQSISLFQFGYSHICTDDMIRTRIFLIRSQKLYSVKLHRHVLFLLSLLFRGGDYYMSYSLHNSHMIHGYDINDRNVSILCIVSGILSGILSCVVSLYLA